MTHDATPGAAPFPASTAMLTLPSSDPAASARFYAEVCNAETVVCASTHALLALPDARLLLYVEHRAHVVPVEMTLPVPSLASFNDTLALWQLRGVPIDQAPMLWPGLGRCFVGLDPDNNRLRMVLAIGWEHGQGLPARWRRRRASGSRVARPVLAILSRLLNGARLWRLPAHRRRVRASRRILRKLRRWDGPEVGARISGYLRVVDPLEVEEVVLSALEDGGHLILRNTSYSGDGGIDGWVRFPRLGWLPLQVKRYRSHVDQRDVETLAQLAARRGLAGALFVHTGRSGAAVYRHLAGRRVVLVSGERLVRLLRTGQVDVAGLHLPPPPAHRCGS